MKTWLSRIGIFLKSLSRWKLDENSWMESGGPETRFYCENGRKLPFDMYYLDNSIINISLSVYWQPGWTEAATEEELKMVTRKLKDYFQSKGYACNVECFDVVKRMQLGNRTGQS